MTNGDKVRGMNNKQLSQMLAMVCPPGNGESRLTCAGRKSCACCWAGMAGKGGGEVKGVDQSDLYQVVALIFWAFDKIQFAIIAYAIGLLCIILRGFERAVKRRIKNRMLENETFRN